MSDDGAITRREFLEAGLAAGAGATLAACGERTVERIIPHVVPIEDVAPGESLYYRTVCRGCPAGCGLSVRTVDGRAVKCEGNPDHPVNAGAVCLRGQAAVPELYSRDRLRGPLAHGKPVSWDAAEAAFSDAIDRAVRDSRRVVVLTRSESGPLEDIFRALGAQVVRLDPTEPGWVRAGVRGAFGFDGRALFDLGRARMILSIGDDFLEAPPSPVEHARGLAGFRERTRATGGRFVYVGPRLSMTAAAADEWLSVRPGSEIDLVLHLARRAPDASAVARSTGLPVDAIARLARECHAARPSLCLGPGPAVAGANADALAAAVHALNFVAGNVGRTVTFVEEPDPAPALADFIRRAEAGEVGVVILHHVDPVGVLGPASPVARALGRVQFVASFTNFLDESAKRAHVVLADHHFLESWGEVSPRPGVVGIQQSVMEPLHGTRAAAEVILAVARRLGRKGDLPDGDFASIARARFSDTDRARGGVFSDAAARPVTLVSNPPETPAAAPPADEGLVLVAFPTLRHLDGRATQVPLLSEIPDPMTSIAWSGWVELHPQAAARAGLATGDIARIESPAGAVELPAYVWPGVREDVVAAPAAFCAGLAGRVRVGATGRRTRLPLVEGSQSQHGAGLAREVRVSAPAAEPRRHASLSIYPDHPHPRHRWGMVVDLDRCTGCGACAAACYVENNIPVVGAADVARGREMAWLRIDRFIEESPAGARASFLPVMCQQCCRAPCESVCPVYATYHHEEGLSAQVYNRCVGTRFCANNCPYGARVFNWHDHRRRWPESLALNPDVSVRERGVVEKCSFCFHRIREAEERARVEGGGRALRDGDVRPACVQTCPGEALVFGDLADPGSRVSRMAAEPRAYRLLEALNTEPGVHYLARLREDHS